MDYSKTPNLRPSVQQKRELPIRSAFVELLGADNGWDIVSNGLNVRFEVELNPGNIYPLAQIDICNLTREHREYLTNYMYFNQDNKRVVRLYAGYLKKGQTRFDTPKLFSGTVIFTSFTNPPDIWTCMQTLYSHKEAMRDNEWLVKGIVPKKTVVEMAAQKLGLKAWFLGNDTPSGDATNFRSSCNGKKLLRDLQRLCPGYSISMRGDDALIVFRKERDEPADGENIWVVREDTGLVGIPSAVLPKGVDCDLLLNPEIYPGDWIKLESIHQPLASGLYRILRVRHHGELRGNDFFTSLETVRPSYYAKEKK